MAEESEEYIVNDNDEVIDVLVRCKNCRKGVPSCGNINCKKDGDNAIEIHPVDWYCADGVKA